MRDSDIDSLSADGAQEPYPADSAEALEAGLRLMLREANAEGHRSWQFIRAKCNELLALQASASSPDPPPGYRSWADVDLELDEAEGEGDES
jgi:hypothetical protein